MKSTTGSHRGGQQISAVGIPWYNAPDYEAILRIMADAAVLPVSHDDWYQRVNQLENNLHAKGHVTYRAVIDPETFPSWCADRGHDVDAGGRIAFANEYAARQVGAIR